MKQILLQIVLWGMFPTIFVYIYNHIEIHQFINKTWNKFLSWLWKTPEYPTEEENIDWSKCDELNEFFNSPEKTDTEKKEYVYLTNDAELYVFYANGNGSNLGFVILKDFGYKEKDIEYLGEL